ncbi:histidine phosphatase family protein [Segnochrobactraceae bacterium EtOH-i3]
MPLTATLIHIRHGQTDWNAEARLQGGQDIPLNDLGRSQAARNGAALGAFLAAEGIDPEGLDWVASPLSRARETMEIVRGAMGLDPAAYRLEPVLKEISFGRWEGFTIPELKLTDPEAVARRRADKWGFVPPDGESYRMLSDRVAGWLDGVGRDSVVVAHGGILRVLHGLLAGVPAAELPLMEVPQDRLCRFAGGRVDWI